MSRFFRRRFGVSELSGLEDEEEEEVSEGLEADEDEDLPRNSFNCFFWSLDNVMPLSVQHHTHAHGRNDTMRKYVSHVFPRACFVSCISRA